MSTNFLWSNDEQSLVDCWLRCASEEEKLALLEQIVDERYLVAPSAKWFPHRPWPKQEALLSLDCVEALYGGAAGGGKSDALLMAALQYVHVPGYAALILRKDTQRLGLAGGLIPRSQQWLAGSNAVWNGTKRTWTFPANSPGGKAGSATLTFGYLQESSDKYRYASSEFQFIGFDELTEFPEEDYLFLFSRLRRTRELRVPLRMRSATNPGNVGHAWVKERFLSVEAIRAGRVAREEESTPTASEEIYWHHGRAFIPARLQDNPALDGKAYEKSLSHLPALARERLLHGDWTVQEQGLIQGKWLRYYRLAGEQLQLLGEGEKVLLGVTRKNVRRIITVDPAGTSRERAAEKRGRMPSWTVVQVWDLVQGGAWRPMILRHQFRGRVGFDGLCAELRRAQKAWRADAVWIENEKLGQAAVDVLSREMRIACIPTRGRDKLTRASVLLLKLEQGEVFLPKEAVSWRGDFESELLSWTGDPEEPSDQIDAAAYAAQVSQQGGGVVRMARVVVG